MGAATRAGWSATLVLVVTAFIVPAGGRAAAADPAFAAVVEQDPYVPAIDPALGATYTMTTSPAGSVSLGYPVVVAVHAKDQQGNPLAGLRVAFNRTAADTETSVFTDSSGDAAYVFEPDTSCISYLVTAVVHDSVTYDGDPADDGIVQQQTTAVSTTENGDVCEIHPLQVALAGRSSFNTAGRPRDVLRVRATAPDSPPAGAPVALMAKIDGDWTQVGRSDRVLDAQGKATFFVRDRRPRRSTAYRAFVAQSGSAQGGASSIYRQR
jgi:hypothetical protein